MVHRMRTIRAHERLPLSKRSARAPQRRRHSPAPRHSHLLLAREARPVVDRCFDPRGRRGQPARVRLRLVANARNGDCRLPPKGVTTRSRRLRGDRRLRQRWSSRPEIGGGASSQCKERLANTVERRVSGEMRVSCDSGRETSG